MSFDYRPYDDRLSDRIDEETREEREEREAREEEYESRREEGEDPRSEDEEAWHNQRDWEETGPTEDDYWGDTDPEDRTLRHD